MQVFCKGFNLYGNLNTTDHMALDFIQAFEIDNAHSLELCYTFSVLTVDQKLLLYSSVDKDKSFSVIDTLILGKICKMTANEDRILVLNDKGEVFNISIQNKCIKAIPKLTVDNDQIQMISIGSKLNIAYSKEGKLYSIPQALEFENRDVIDLKTGREHCILLDIFGSVFTFGRGSRGQLGHGSLEDITNPKLVEALSGIKIVQIAAGGWHSVAISEQGDLYSWGWNANGQLGLSEVDEPKFVSVMATPHVVDVGDANVNVHKVACGCRHTIALLDNGILYGCGWNKYKQLTKDEKEMYYTFTYLHDFSNHNVQSLKCGPWNTAVICK